MVRTKFPPEPQLIQSSAMINNKSYKIVLYMYIKLTNKLYITVVMCIKQGLCDCLSQNVPVSSLDKCYFTNRVVFVLYTLSILCMKNMLLCVKKHWLDCISKWLWKESSCVHKVLFIDD